MKKTRILFLLLAGVLLLAGCQKEGKVGGNDAIRFTASSNPDTKTSYTGVYNGGIERIDWKLGDEIRIFSDKAKHRYQDRNWADYVITEIVGNGDKANIDNVPGDGTGNGLVWDAAGDYQFYAIYPPLDSPEGNLGVLSASIPATQAIDPSAIIPAPDMKYAVMTAYQKMTTTVDGEGGDINLAFSPAFTAFEFTFNSDIPLKILGFKLFSVDGSTAVAGKYRVKFDSSGRVTYDCRDASSDTVEAVFSDGVSIDDRTPFTFTVFALPQDLSGIGIEFMVNNTDWDVPETRTLKLNYKNGEPVPFKACAKHRIKGTLQGTWSFKYITLNGVAAEWDDEDVELVSDKLPQSTQFAVSGVRNVYDLSNNDDVYKTLRQTWVLGDRTATVSFKVFSPVGGSYKIKPFVKNGTTITEGVGDFVVAFEEGDYTGSIGSDDSVSSRIKFTVKGGRASAGDELFFKTYVEDTSGLVYSLDSETQLFDTRGYHYFRVDNPLD